MDESWDPGQYLRFADHRSRPAFEMLNRVDHHHPARVVDLGCGTGDIARAMKRRWPNARVIGLDRSADMLANAVESGGEVEWLEADLITWTSDYPIDVLYSNAALHWLPEHHVLFPRLISLLAPGGVLAVQMPLSWSEPSHVLMRETLATGGLGGSPLGPRSLRTRLARKWVAAPTDYHDLLAPLIASLDIWTTRYLQVLEGPEPVFEWVKGTGLRPVLETLDGPDLDTFLIGYRNRLLEAYPQTLRRHDPLPIPAVVHRGDGGPVGSSEEGHTVEPDNQRRRRKPTPEQAAIWILGIVLFAVVAFVVVLAVIN
jgi:trans-aconitate 2-methyltransferase